MMTFNPLNNLSKLKFNTELKVITLSCYKLKYF